MKLLIFAITAFCLNRPLVAQQPLAAPLPSGPLLRRAPDFSQWTVVSQYSGEAGAANANQGAKGKTLLQATVVKTSSIIYEQLIDNRGRKSEVWHKDGIQMFIASGSSARVFPDSGGSDIYTVNYATADFAGLDWISSRTYTGVVKYRERDCMVFRGEVNTLPADQRRDLELQISRATSEARGRETADKSRSKADPIPIFIPKITNEPAIGYVDLETRLPVLATLGKETRQYQFGPAPTSMLTLPANMVGLLTQYQQEMRRLAAPPAKAY